jgi:ubiquinone/menaquinone biosynthesis C-methylase UbiE
MAPRALARFFVTLLVTVGVTVGPAAASAQPSGITNGQIFDALGIQSGRTVCEMGAGDGELSLAAAKIVGPEGRIYTSELGDDRLKALRNRMAASTLTQITVIAGDASQTNFPAGECDALFMRNVYHHFADPPAMNASIALALKPGGRLAVVDFTPPPGNEAACPADRGKDGMHGITAATLTRELTEAGFGPVTSTAAQRAIMVVVVKR